VIRIEALFVAAGISLQALSAKRGMIGRLSALTFFAAHMAACSFTAPTMDLREIERTRSPHDALACPAGLCRAQPDFDSPIFSVDKKTLLERAKTVIIDESRTELVGEDAALNQLVFVQRSAVFGFPDTVWVQGVIVGARTSVIVYSRSNYGYWDMGVNRNRVRAWLEKLKRPVNKGRDQTSERLS
jgi:uncharacterized protein (DUF1499 family)